MFICFYVYFTIFFLIFVCLALFSLCDLCILFSLSMERVKNTMAVFFYVRTYFALLCANNFQLSEAWLLFNRTESALNSQNRPEKKRNKTKNRIENKLTNPNKRKMRFFLSVFRRLFNFVCFVFRLIDSFFLTEKKNNFALINNFSTIDTIPTIKKTKKTKWDLFRMWIFFLQLRLLLLLLFTVVKVGIINVVFINS